MSAIDTQASEVLSLQSKAIDSEVSVEVSLPQEYEYSRREYPVLYILDGPAYFDLIVDFSVYSSKLSGYK